jgi:hypothetical protein
MPAEDRRPQAPTEEGMGLLPSPCCAIEESGAANVVPGAGAIVGECTLRRTGRAPGSSKRAKARQGSSSIPGWATGTRREPELVTGLIRDFLT